MDNTSHEEGTYKECQHTIALDPLDDLGALSVGLMEGVPKHKYNTCKVKTKLATM